MNGKVTPGTIRVVSRNTVKVNVAYYSANTTVTDCNTDPSKRSVSLVILYCWPELYVNICMMNNNAHMQGGPKQRSSSKPQPPAFTYYFGPDTNQALINSLSSVNKRTLDTKSVSLKIEHKSKPGRKRS